MRITPAVSHLLILNILFFAASFVFRSSLHTDLDSLLGLHYVGAESFRPWQFLTYMFLHADLSHIFFNMFAVWMFGTLIEQVLSTKRFLVYYIVCGLGAAVIQQISTYLSFLPLIEAVDNLMTDMTTGGIQDFLNSYAHPFSSESALLIDTFVRNFNELSRTSSTEAMNAARTFLTDFQQLYIDSQVTIGASGAVFGVLLAMGIIFPNMRLMLLFPPIPIKAKWFVIGYGVIELFAGVADFQFDNVAHWAHLGGMVFGFILLRAWKVERFN